MERSALCPDPGRGPAPRDLSPGEAKQFFEFFKVGAKRDVLLLGDPVEQRVHWHNEQKHKMLCTRSAGGCELCDVAGSHPHISVQQVEFLVPAFVRPAREKQFGQCVAVFPRGACDKLLSLVGGSCRGNLVLVCRGTSNRLELKRLDHIPAGFPAIIPPAFDVLPWVRARFGRQQDPARPLVFLPAFHCQPLGAGPIGRPQALELSASDRTTDPGELEKMKSIISNGLASLKPDKDRGPPAATTRAAPVAPADDQGERDRRAELKHKPADELTADEAVESNRIVDYVAAGIPSAATLPFSRNGKKGGGK